METDKTAKKELEFDTDGNPIYEIRKSRGTIYDFLCGKVPGVQTCGDAMTLFFTDQRIRERADAASE